MKIMLKKTAAGLCAAATLCGSLLPTLPDGLSLLAPALTASAGESAKAIDVGVYYQIWDRIDFGEGAYFVLDDSAYVEADDDGNLICNESAWVDMIPSWDEECLFDTEDSHSFSIFCGSESEGDYGAKYTGLELPAGTYSLTFDCGANSITDGELRIYENNAIITDYYFSVDYYEYAETNEFRFTLDHDASDVSILFEAYVNPGVIEGSMQVSDFSFSNITLIYLGGYLEGAYGVNYSTFDEERGQYLFWLDTSNSQNNSIWITAEANGDALGLIVTDGDGSVEAPYQFMPVFDEPVV